MLEAGGDEFTATNNTDAATMTVQTMATAFFLNDDIARVLPSSRAALEDSGGCSIAGAGDSSPG